jgi:hypothetical protein
MLQSNLRMRSRIIVGGSSGASSQVKLQDGDEVRTNLGVCFWYLIRFRHLSGEELVNKSSIRGRRYARRRVETGQRAIRQRIQYLNPAFIGVW